jgi:hypothetical protein
LRSGVTSIPLYYRSPWTFANFGEGIDFIVDFYCDPSKTLPGCVAVDATKGVPDGSRTT